MRVLGVLLKNDPQLAELLTDFITDTQLFRRGVDAEGTKLNEIGGEYSDFTREIKSMQGLPTEWITLFDTGQFYESFEVSVTDSHLSITADTVKGNTDLRDRWGEHIASISPEGLAEFVFAIKPEFAELVKSELLK